MELAGLDASGLSDPESKEVDAVFESTATEDGERYTIPREKEMEVVGELGVNKESVHSHIADVLLEGWRSSTEDKG